MATTVRHPDRLAEQVNRILANPKSWDQAVWHSPCGTTHCIAGHGQIAAGYPVGNGTCRDEAQEWYGITDDDAEWLFSSYRTLHELHGFARSALAGKPHFDADGYDPDGHDRDGLDRDGYDSYGFDPSGSSRCDYDRSGYDRDGYSRDGFDCDGLDRNGDSLPLLNIAALAH